MSLSGVAAAAAATVEYDDCTKAAVGVIVLLVRLAVGSAMTLPPERIMSPRELTLERIRGRAMSRSAGDDMYEVALDAPGGSITDGSRISGDPSKLGKVADRERLLD